PADVVVRVCRDMTCHLREATGLAEGLRDEFKKSGLTVEYAFPDEGAGPSTPGASALKRPFKDPGGQEPYPRTGPVRSVRIEGVSCLGRCDRAPAVCVSRHVKQAIHERNYMGRPREQLLRAVLAVARGAEPGDARIAADTDEKHTRPPDLDKWNINYYKRNPG